MLAAYTRVIRRRSTICRSVSSTSTRPSPTSANRARISATISSLVAGWATLVQIADAVGVQDGELAGLGIATEIIPSSRGAASTVDRC